MRILSHDNANQISMHCHYLIHLQVALSLLAVGLKNMAWLHVVAGTKYLQGRFGAGTAEPLWGQRLEPPRG